MTLLDKILTDASSGHKAVSISHIECGENGDAFLNPKAIDCFRLIRSKIPEAKVHVFSNFDNLTSEISEVLVKERLVDGIGVNIDGSTPQTYQLVKGLDYENVRRNIIDFLEARRRYSARIPLTILSIPYRKYVDCIQNNFGFSPTNLKDRSDPTIKNDFRAIAASWRPLLDATTDRIVAFHTVVGWAEREHLPGTIPNEKKYICPRLERVKHDAFIDPEGSWYLCCMDYKSDCVIGNVGETALGDLATSEERMTVIKRLEAREFSMIGPPCSSVTSCQSLHQSRIVTKMIQKGMSNRVSGVLFDRFWRLFAA